MSHKKKRNEIILIPLFLFQITSSCDLHFISLSSLYQDLRLQ